MRILRQTTLLSLVIAILLLFGSCQKQYRLTSKRGCALEITNTLDSHPDSASAALLTPYKKVIDSIKAPVLGESEMEMEADRPESLLGNFAADALFVMANKKSTQPVDMALTNKGGLRNTMPQGKVTFGDVYNIFPFENSLCILELSGEQLIRLFENIASAKGEPVSNARLQITGDGELVKGTIGGKAVEPGRTYRIATLDYLAQGNDKMTTLAEGKKIDCPQITIRQLIVDYITDLTQHGKKISSTLDGRITIVTKP